MTHTASPVCGITALGQQLLYPGDGQWEQKQAAFSAHSQFTPQGLRGHSQEKCQVTTKITEDLHQAGVQAKCRREKK